MVIHSHIAFVCMTQEEEKAENKDDNFIDCLRYQAKSLLSVLDDGKLEEIFCLII